LSTFVEERHNSKSGEEKKSQREARKLVNIEGVRGEPWTKAGAVGHMGVPENLKETNAEDHS